MTSLRSSMLLWSWAFSLSLSRTFPRAVSTCSQRDVSRSCNATASCGSSCCSTLAAFESVKASSDMLSLGDEDCCKLSRLSLGEELPAEDLLRADSNVPPACAGTPVEDAACADDDKALPAGAEDSRRMLSGGPPKRRLGAARGRLGMLGMLLRRGDESAGAESGGPQAGRADRRPRWRRARISCDGRGASWVQPSPSPRSSALEACETDDASPGQDAVEAVATRRQVRDEAAASALATCLASEGSAPRGVRQPLWLLPPAPHPSSRPSRI
mmetsp:Transcript_69372/g.206624  ORF Transcript_69372/g.206624 Transcript_69372/m.206624 type:complete len:271 (+) Transcript_69372:604-1416(+)